MLICTVFPHFGTFRGGGGGTKFRRQEFDGRPDFSEYNKLRHNVVAVFTWPFITIKLAFSLFKILAIFGSPSYSHVYAMARVLLHTFYVRIPKIITQRAFVCNGRSP